MSTPEGTPQQPNEQQPPPQQPYIEPRNAFGTVALILGIVGLLFGIVPLTGFIAVALGVTGLILALSARGRLRRGTATNKKTTIWGGILSSLAIVLGIIGIVIVFTAVDELDRNLEELGNETEEYIECVDRAGADLDALTACNDLQNN